MFPRRTVDWNRKLQVVKDGEDGWMDGCLFIPTSEEVESDIAAA
jgi:hypothetical protein